MSGHLKKHFEEGQREGTRARGQQNEGKKIGRRGIGGGEEIRNGKDRKEKEKGRIWKRRNE